MSYAAFFDRHRTWARLAAITLPAVVVLPLLGGTALAAKGGNKTSVPTISTRPASPTAATTATFAFTSKSPGATFTCQLDGGAAGGCVSPVTYTGLANGTHTFAVRAHAPGKPQSNWARASWTVDTVPPAQPTVSQPSSPTRSTSVSISFSSDDPSTVAFGCSLDGAAATPCTSPFAHSGLTEGSHSLAVTARDSVGNPSLARTVGWVVDHTAPAVPVVTGPVSPTNATAAQVSFTDEATDVTGFTCALDGAAAVACTSPWNIPGPLAEGRHAVVVAATDAANNVTTGQTSWVVDLTPPATPSIQTGPAEITNKTTASFGVPPVVGATLQCSLNGATWAACPDPVSYAVTDGAHQLAVRAVDTAGNASAADTWAWTVDATAPAPASFLGGPSDPSNDTLPSFTFDATDGSENGFFCSLDGAAFTECENGEQFAVSGDGVHVLKVKNVDLANNASAPTSWVWTLDTTAPAVPTFDANLPTRTKATSLTLGFDVDASAASTECALDGGALIACADGETFAGLSEGSHTARVVTRDAAGNASEATFGWVVDLTRPTATSTTKGGVTSPVHVLFSEPVTGVKASSVGLRVKGSTSNLPLASISCYSGADVAPCSGLVTKAVLKAKSVLVPGQTYVPVVTSAVKDRVGHAVRAQTTAYRAALKHQENSPAVLARWAKVSADAAYGNAYVQERRAKASVSYTFSGTSVTWYTVTGPNQGFADVYVDGAQVKRVNNYSAGKRFKVARSVSGLAKGAHTLKIVVVGKHAKKSSGTYVAVDAVKSGGTIAKNPSLTAAWGRTAKAAASGGYLARSDVKGAVTEFRFRGTSLSWLTMRGPDQGKARVVIDGDTVAVVDNYAAAAKYKAVRTFGNLANVVHTVKIVVLHDKRKRATGYAVAVDRLTVR